MSATTTQGKVLFVVQNGKQIDIHLFDSSANRELTMASNVRDLETAHLLASAPALRNVLIGTVARITNYLGSGGLFNPEMMDHEKVLAMLVEIRDAAKTAIGNDNQTPA